MGTNGHTDICETYVSFDCAKLLKEKGFDIPCQSYYCVFENGDVVHTTFAPLENHNHEKFTSRPTHQMALRWLREIYNIDIIIFHEKLPNDLYWARIEKYPYTEYQTEPIYETYEEAVEAALKYTLENLI